MKTPCACIREPGACENLHMVGQDVRVVLSAADTGGSHTLFDITVPVGDGPPPHVHSVEDETFFVLEGELEFFVGHGPYTPPSGPSAPRGSWKRVGAGACAFGPRGVAHTFRNPTGKPARMLVLCTPGGFERFGQALAREFPKGTPPDPAVFSRIMGEFGMQVAV